jgi:protein-tyrosine-phosphatase/predicted ATP-grasp superfamily ATP-dependent carboligase
MKILIVDEGVDRSSVAAARALASRGWTVGVASWSPANLAARSRAVASWHHVPHTKGDDPVDDERFLSGLQDVVTRFGYDTAVASWTAAVALISRNRDHLGFPVGYGSHEGLMVALDKERLTAEANSVGLAAPQAIPADDASLRALEVPVVVKPALQTESTLAARRCATPSVAIAHRDAILADGGRPLVQEVLQEPLTAVSFVTGPDGFLTYCQQVAIRTWPPEVGVTARGVTTAVDEALRERVERLVERLDYQGLAQIQFLAAADGTLRLIDFNPRYYGSLELAIRAGANHPDAWACLTTGRATRRAVARPGVRFQWLTRDLRASLHAGGPRAAAGAVAFAPRAVHSVWHADDPMLAWKFLRLGLGRRAAKPPRRYRATRLLKGVEPLLEPFLRAGPIRRRLGRRARAAWRTSREPLIVCHGNVNRSPFAEALARKRPASKATSAGFIAEAGRGASEVAIRVGRDHGLDLSRHRSKEVGRRDLATADAIFVFDFANVVHILLTAPSALSRTHFVGALLADGPVFIGDPHGLTDDEQAAAIFSRIADAVSAGESDAA